MALNDMQEIRAQLIPAVKDFVRKEVIPKAAQHDEEDTYPAELVDQMAEIGLFGMVVPEKYGGMGLDVLTFSMVFEELSKGWMSITGPIGTHSMLAFAISKYGTDEQKQRWLPDLATGKKRGGLALTEPSGGSDVAGIKTNAMRDGEEYVINGTKQFITSGSKADIALVIAVTDPEAGKKGMSCFIVPTDAPGYNVASYEQKLGQRAHDTCQIVFEDLF